MTRPLILHLVDDLTCGGVTRVLDHIQSCPKMAQDAEHRVQPVKRGAFVPGRVEADIIVSHLSVSWRTLPALIALRALKASVPLVHVEHSYTEAFAHHNVTRTGRFLSLLRTAYALFDRVVAVSEGQAEWLSKADLVQPEHLSVIRSCVDYRAFRALPAPAGPIRTFGAVGRLERQKGFDTMIEAFIQVKVPDIRLEIFGTGPQEAELRTLARSDGRIRFMGFTSDPAMALASVDAVLMPSRWEAYGLVAAEALSARRPVLVNAIDGLTDHAEYGASVVADASAATWAKAISAASRIGVPPPRPTAQLEISFAAGWHRLISELMAPGVVEQGADA